MPQLIIGILIFALAVAAFIYIVLPLAAATLVAGAAFGLLRALAAWLVNFWQQCVTRTPAPNVNSTPAT